ncbi:enoyl-CoA hydratase-related protein [Metapseudomonas furukawaii]|uniref:enoyl-CoA hydratase n=1 Tax=Metapseudomonas furukawaii TaxID=1149133 RepID=A0AAD1C085_METFU|nr:enoyl-CoA hydratase-related protein [Pseudomonas furukawaii]ELS24991.1 Enoyl-CoA hydratase [Pseudomonas furukawaii]BAU74211.1 enoyl-CoA hydratase [Pseudomonas furukawaii]
MTYETLLVEQAGAVGLVTLNRPDALNAINTRLIDELNQVLDGFERDASIGSILITGSRKAFAAGADVKEMAPLCFPGTYLDDFLGRWDRVAQRRKPIIAAVAGHALGGGFELALMCDFIIAADNARFGLPEVKLGVIPGAGGVQRLTRLVGRAKAMEMVLSGRSMDAAEAERAGVVARVVPLAELLDQALASAQAIAAQSRTAVMMLKECVNRVDEGSMAEGLRFERRMFQAVFATPDQKEGMGAFVEKRPPQFGR